MLVALVEKEKSDIIERDTSQMMGKSITDENEDETSLKGVEGDSIHDFATLPAGLDQVVSGRTVTVKSEGVCSTMWS